MTPVLEYGSLASSQKAFLSITQRFMKMFSLKIKHCRCGQALFGPFLQVLSVVITVSHHRQFLLVRYMDKDVACKAIVCRQQITGQEEHIDSERC